MGEREGDSGQIMTEENGPPKREPDPERLLALKSLPPEIMKRLTKEEVEAFLFEEVWPETLRDKLMDYLIEEG